MLTPRCKIHQGVAVQWSILHAWNFAPFRGVIYTAESPVLSERYLHYRVAIKINFHNLDFFKKRLKELNIAKQFLGFNYAV